MKTDYFSLWLVFSITNFLPSTITLISFLLPESSNRHIVPLETFIAWPASLEISKSKINQAEFHCGIWLALYHNKVLNGGTKGLVFTDFTVNNIMLNYEQQSVIALDPGWAWGQVGYLYRDLIRHILSILLTLVVRRKAPFSTILSFLRGYVSVTKVKLNLVHYYKSLYLEFCEQGNYYSTRSKVRFVSFLLITIVLSLFILFLFPGICL